MQTRARLARITAVGLAVGLVATAAACSPGDGDDAAVAIIEECVDDPNNCLSGPIAEGGSITFIMSQPAVGWNLISPAGGSVYGVQALAGVLPNTGYGAPDGEYTFDLDVLAQEPELISEDPWTHQWVINDAAVWDDGTPITGDDFLITWYMSQSTDRGYCDTCQSRSSAGSDKIDSIEVSEDGKTVTVVESEPNLEWFGSWGIGSVTSGLWPAYVAEREGVDWQDPAELGEYFDYLSNNVPDWSGGPFRIVEGDLETRIVKEPNPSWWGEGPYLDTVIHRVMVDDGGWVDAFANGEIDGGSPPDVNQDVVEQLLNRDDVLVHVGESPAWEHLDMNLVNPQLQDVELRRAIFTAVDRDDIGNRNYGRVFPDWTPRNNFSSFLVDGPWYQDHITGTGFGTGDAAEARAILDAAGYEGFDEGEGPLTLNGEQIGPFRLRTTESSQRATSVTLIQEQLNQIGVETAIEFTDTLGDTLGEGDYDLMVFGWSGNPAFFQANAEQYAESSNSSNFGRYSNPAYDALAQQVLGATTQDEAAVFTNQAYEVLAPDAYILPLYDTPGTFWVRDTYVNVRNNGNDNRRGMYNMHQWALRADE